jgi:hypothetical protein
MIPAFFKPFGQHRIFEKFNFFAPYAGSAVRLRALQRKLNFSKNPAAAQEA